MNKKLGLNFKTSLVYKGPQIPPFSSALLRRDNRACWLPVRGLGISRRDRRDQKTGVGGQDPQQVSDHSLSKPGARQPPIKMRC